MKRPVILIAEGNEVLRQVLKELFLRQGCEVMESSDKASALRSVQHRSQDLVIVGSSRNGSWEGLAIAQQIRRWDRRVPLILMVANSSEELAVAALKAGVNDYFKKPFSFEELAASVNRCLADCLLWESSAKQDKTAGSIRLTPGGSIRLTPGSDFTDSQRMIGKSLPMREIKAYILKVAPTDTTVLITGETGTGKELATELIHRNSLRHRKPLVCINCAATPDSLLESELFGYERGAFTGAHTLKEGTLKLADRGTVFFDEIGDMSPYAQAKILRAIETKEIHRLGGRGSIPLDVRVLAATNQDLEQLVAEGKFRKDLYFRLNVARVHLPPLRDRKEDIPLLGEHYIRELNRRFGREVEGFSEEALESLLHYDWPGNVRELRNLLEAIFVNLPSRRITLVDLPEPFRRRLQDAEGLPQGERDRLLSTLFSTRWNKSKAAQKLHWSRMTLYRKLAKYHIISSRGKTEGGTPMISDREL